MSLQLYDLSPQVIQHFQTYLMEKDEMKKKNYSFMITDGPKTLNKEKGVSLHYDRVSFERDDIRGQYYVVYKMSIYSEMENLERPILRLRLDKDILSQIAQKFDVYIYMVYVVSLFILFLFSHF